MDGGRVGRGSLRCSFGGFALCALRFSLLQSLCLQKRLSRATLLLETSGLDLLGQQLIVRVAVAQPEAALPPNPPEAVYLLALFLWTLSSETGLERMDRKRARLVSGCFPEAVHTDLEFEVHILRWVARIGVT